MAAVALLFDDAEAAREAAERALALCGDGDFPEQAPSISATLGLAKARLGRVDEGLPLLEWAASDAAAAQESYTLAHRVTCLAEAYRRAGRSDDARALAEARGAWGSRAWALALLGEIGLQAPSERERGRAAIGEALAMATAAGMRPLVRRCSRLLALRPAH